MVETFSPGYLDSLELNYEVLKKINPSLVLTSITGFGQTGPWKNYKTSDMVAQASGGLTFVCGWPDRPPLRMGGLIAYYQASIEAAVGTLIAYYNQLMTGEGQHLDTSLHESVPICIQSRTLMYQKTGVIGTRLGDEHSETMNGIFPCQDGYVDFRLLIPRWDDFVKWLDSESMAADLKDEKWRVPFLRNQQENSAHIDQAFRAFAAKHTKKYIYEEGQNRGFVVGAVNTFPEFEKNDQLAARSFFVNVEHPEPGASLKYLGAPYKLSETPWQINRRAPLIGEHNLEINI